jgi:hypothetical protein
LLLAVQGSAGRPDQHATVAYCVSKLVKSLTSQMEIAMRARNRAAAMVHFDRLRGFTHVHRAHILVASGAFTEDELEDLFAPVRKQLYRFAARLEAGAGNPPAPLSEGRLSPTPPPQRSTSSASNRRALGRPRPHPAAAQVDYPIEADLILDSYGSAAMVIDASSCQSSSDRGVLRERLAVKHAIARRGSESSSVRMANAPPRGSSTAARSNTQLPPSPLPAVSSAAQPRRRSSTAGSQSDPRSPASSISPHKSRMSAPTPRGPMPPTSTRGPARSFFSRERERKTAAEFAAQAARDAAARAEEAARLKALLVLKQHGASRVIGRWWKRELAWRSQVVQVRQRRRARGEATLRLAPYLRGCRARMFLGRYGAASKAAVIVQSAVRRYLARRHFAELRRSVQARVEAAEASDRLFLDRLLRGVRLFQARQLLRRRRLNLQSSNARRLGAEACDSEAIVAALEARLGTIEAHMESHLSSSADDGLAPSARRAAATAAADEARKQGRLAADAMVSAACAWLAVRDRAAISIQAAWRANQARFDANARAAQWTLRLLQANDSERGHRCGVLSRVAHGDTAWADAFVNLRGRRQSSENFDAVEPKRNDHREAEDTQ